MTARILIACVPQTNAKLLESKLSAEYFEVEAVSTAKDVLAKVNAFAPDVILLQAAIDNEGWYDLCHQIKNKPNSSNVSVAVITAADAPILRRMALDAGADDFLVNPVTDMALFVRVRSLVRLKMMVDELSNRREASARLGLGDVNTLVSGNPSGHILLVDDRADSAVWLRTILEPWHHMSVASTLEDVMAAAKVGDLDLIIVALGTPSFDGLRVCSQLRSQPETQLVSVLVLVSQGEDRALLRALEMGVNDYLPSNADRSEVLARVRTQIRRKMYGNLLRDNMRQTLELAALNRDLRSTPSHTPVQKVAIDPPPEILKRSMTDMPSHIVKSERHVPEERRSLAETLKSLGSAFLGLAIFVGIVLVGVLFFFATTVATAAVYPYLIVLTQYALPLCGLVLLPLTAFKFTRSFALLSIYACSFLFGALNWAFGFLVTYDIWGVIGVIVGLCIAGVGVVPVAILASALNSEWGLVWNLLFGAAITYGARVFAIYQVNKDEHEGLAY